MNLVMILRERIDWLAALGIIRRIAGSILRTGDRHLITVDVNKG
jgi:hypothetical protein